MDRPSTGVKEGDPNGKSLGVHWGEMPPPASGQPHCSAAGVKTLVGTTHTE